MPEQNKIGGRLKALRRGRRLTQEDAAGAVGLSRSHLAGIERGHDLPGRELLIALANYYKVSVDWLATPADNDARPPMPTDIRVARLRALRLAWWGEEEAAAAQLGVSIQKLQEQESGGKPMDSEYVLKVLSVTRTSPTWIYDGNLEDVSPLVAARLAVVAPELIEGLDGGLGDQPKKAAEGGGTR
jgi:transcriptional regulator with XRE-family HTH domain